MTINPESPKRVPAEPESPDQLPSPVEPEAPDQLPPQPPAPKSSGVLERLQRRPSPYAAHYARVGRRRDKIRAEIERNRRGEAAIPTWVLAVILVVLVGGLAAIVIFA